MKLRVVLTLLLCLSFLGSPRGQTSPTTSASFQKFWLQFQSAVLKEDRETIANLTSFPFYLDEQVDRAQFLKKFNVLFTPKVKACFANAQPVKDDIFNTVFCSPDLFRFGQKDGGWKLIEVANND